MPQYFSFTRISDPEAGPVPSRTINEEMCKHFNVPCDPVEYHAHWYTIIGLPISCGSTALERDKAGERLRRCREDSDVIPEFSHLIDVLDWLQSNFTIDTWYQPK